MAEQRLIDANILLDKCESLYMRGHILFHGVTACTIENAPTIDPETIPVVRQLREELARVTAERDAAVEQLRGYCPACKSYTKNHCEWPCEDCKHEYYQYRSKNAMDNWEWRGLQRRPAHE